MDNKAEIKSISVRRKEFTLSPNGGATSAGTSTQSGIADIISQTILSSTWPGELIQKNYEHETGTIYPDSTDAPVKSQITKWPFEINSDISLYSIIDYDVSAFQNEYFKYSIKISYVSLIDEMLKNKIYEMENCLSEIQSNNQFFYNNARYYDHEYQAMSPAGFKEINKQYGFGVLDADGELIYSSIDDNHERQESAYWTKAPQLYSELMRFLKSSNNEALDYITLFNLLNPISASPETMGMAIGRIRDIINIVKSKYDISSSGNLYANSSLPTTNSKIYEYDFISNELVEHAGYSSGVPQYEYLLQDTDREILASALEQRIDTELAEFLDGLNTLDPSQYPDYSQQQLSQILSPNGSYSFLTPLHMIFQGNNINMTSLDTTEIDKVRAIKISTQQLDGLNILAPITNLHNKKNTTTDALDVREYVGDTSYFATGTDNFLDSFFKAPPEISKTISNFYSNKGTNVNLALFKDSVISTNMLPATIKSILAVDFGSVDPFADLETRDAFFNKYFNIIQISYLASFPKGHHLYNVSNPIYEPLTKDKLNETQNYLICKSEPINVLSLVNSSYEEIERKNIKNRVFIVKGDNVP